MRGVVCVRVAGRYVTGTSHLAAPPRLSAVGWEVGPRAGCRVEGAGRGGSAQGGRRVSRLAQRSSGSRIYTHNGDTGPYLAVNKDLSRLVVMLSGGLWLPTWASS